MCKRSAIISIPIADVTMRSRSQAPRTAVPGMLIFDLALSIALMAVAANLVASLLERYRWLAYLEGSSPPSRSA
jgi:predicted tellurium resistance membrane protein TerC